MLLPNICMVFENQIVKYLCKTFLTILCLFFLTITLNAQDSSNVEEEIEIDFPIKLSEGITSEDTCISKSYQSCIHYKIPPKASADPRFSYYADEFLEKHVRYVKVWLVNARTGKIVRLKKRNKKWWKSKVQNTFQVIEKWKYKPGDQNQVFRLRWNYAGEDYYSKPFELHLKSK